MQLSKKILVLLSTYNGDKYLKQQINSIYQQTYRNIKIIARDDGSTDNTLKILQSCNVELIAQNENYGARRSFSILLEYALKSNDEYFMFCDQDDIWENNKIEISLKKMQEIEKHFSGKPLLIHTDLEIVNKDLKIIDMSMWHYEHLDPRFNSFNRLLIQNTITGCTVMINRKLAELATPIPSNAIMHDWWLGLIASKFGNIGFINESTIKYRQHNSNSIGAKSFDWLSIFLKFYKIFYKNKFYLEHLQVNIKQARAFLERYEDNLDERTIKMLEDFTSLESKSFWQRRKILLKYRLLKHGFMRNLGLLLKI